MIGRRGFIVHAGASAGVAGMGLTPAGALAGAKGAAGDAQPAAALFRSLLHTRFTVFQGFSKAVDTELVAVTERESAALGTSPRLEQFHITLLDRAGHGLPEGLFEVSHPEAGWLRMHLQPAGADERGSYYTATFSLLG